jgi:hypothetical protein
MKSRRSSRLKKNPIVRFIQRVLKFLSALFKPKKSTSKSIRDRQITSEDRHRFQLPASSIDLERPKRYSKLIIVSDVSERRKRQVEPAKIQPEISHNKWISPVNNLPRERSMTVGELFGKVKWQTPANLQQIISADSNNVDRDLMTVGELFQQVKWQTNSANNKKPNFDDSNISGFYRGARK